MKKIIYILLLIIFIVSCKNNEAMDMKIEEVAIESEEGYEFSDVPEVYKFQNITTQKLEDYFDLVKLKASHPEFKEDIEYQLKSFTNESIFSYSGDFTIENIHQVGEVQKVSDSVQKIKLVYDVIIYLEKVSDSVYAIITSKTILLDEEEIKSNKVTFSKE